MLGKQMELGNSNPPFQLILRTIAIVGFPKEGSS